MKKLLAITIALAAAGQASVVAAQSRADHQIRGALFAGPTAAGIDAASHKSRETQRRAVPASSGPEAALLAGAGIISPMPYVRLPMCDDQSRNQPPIDCQILKRQKSR